MALCLAKLYPHNRSTGPGQGHTCMMSRAVQGTAPQLRSRPSYVGTSLGLMWWLPVRCFTVWVEAEDLLRPMDGFSSCFDSMDGFVQEELHPCDTGVGRNKLCIHPIRWMCFSDTSLSFLLGSIALYLSTTRLLPFNSTWCFHTEIHPNRISTRASESKQGSANKTKRTCIPIQAKTAITTKTDLVTRLKTWKGIGLENRSEDHPNRFNGNVTLSRKSR